MAILRDIPTFLSLFVAFPLWAALPAQEPPGDPTLVETTERFTLHSSPLLNLHHFLFQWARSEIEPAQDDTRPPVEVPEKDRIDRLTNEERRIWDEAVQHYQTRVPRSLTFNGALIRLKATLLSANPATDEEVNAQTLAQLQRALPVYRRHWWRDHDRRNREWIAQLHPRLAEFEGPVGDRLAAAWAGTWPGERIRVDLSAYVNWAGAYTTNRPSHVMISSRENAGWGGFETVFHESSHTWPLAGDHQEVVDAAFRSRGKEQPNRFWHALIFYTSGELTRQLLESQGVDDYRSYAETAGFYDGPGWAGYRAAFDAHWRAWVAGEIDRETALSRIASAISR